MKVLIDEYLPAGLKEDLAALGHECQTYAEPVLDPRKTGSSLRLLNTNGMSFSRATGILNTSRT